MESPHTQPDQVLELDAGQKLKLGLLANNTNSEETRFLLTPEACGMLVSSGIDILMEKGAAIDLDFKDKTYVEYGVQIVDRATALRQQVVLSYVVPGLNDIRHMSPGSVLFCMEDPSMMHKNVILALLRQRITLGCFARMYSHNDEFVFANVIDEIDGRTAIMYAEEALSFLGGGKGVLLGGVPGLPPSEILMIGSGQKIGSAARAALSVGASVTLMDNDVSALQVAQEYCGPHLVTASIHPRVLCNKAKSADVLIMDTCSRPFELPAKIKAMMKENIYVLDFNRTEPSVCVPRTVAMALSNILVNFFTEMSLKDGFIGMLMTSAGMQHGIITFEGSLTDKLLGTLLGVPSTDINLILTGTN